MSGDKHVTVIFDFDGTLANTLDLIVKIYNENADRFKVKKVTPDEFSKLRTMGYKKAMKAKGVRWWMLPKLVLFIRQEMKAHMSDVQPFDGIVSMLEDVKVKGASIGILTSNDNLLVQEFLHIHDFPVFDFIVSEKTIFGKHRAIRRIMQRHGLSSSEVIYVGDEMRDVTASQKAGIKVIGVTWGFGGEEGMAETPPDVLVKTVPALKRAILSELKAQET